MQGSLGLLVTEGISYWVPDRNWFSTLSVGQPVEFAYSIDTRYAFASDHIALTPLAVVLTIVVLCFGILIGILCYYAPVYHGQESSTSPPSTQ